MQHKMTPNRHNNMWRGAGRTFDSVDSRSVKVTEVPLDAIPRALEVGAIVGVVEVFLQIKGKQGAC